MKMTLCVILLLSMALLASCDDTDRSQATTSTITDAASRDAVSASTFIGVDELMKNVDKYRSEGEIIIEGIVSAAAEGQVALIDCGEWEACGVISCAELTLPVEWAGPTPQLKQRVRLHGQVREAEDKLIFTAERLEVVETQKENGG